MGESYWPETTDQVVISDNTVLAQTFMPLWSHTIEHLRVKPGFMLPWHILEVSLQYLKPDGTPTGAKLASIVIDFFEQWATNFFGTSQTAFPPFRLVAGIHYAFVFRQLIPGLLPWMRSLYVPPPSGYPRGKLIRSLDGGSTWDTTDLGDIMFAEWGDPPRATNPHVLPLDHWAAINLGTTHYSTSMCIRISTTSPVYAVCHVADKEPKANFAFRTVRGKRLRCWSYYSFQDWRSYRQLEKFDSIYHTFHIKQLKARRQYWFTFTAESDFTLSSSISPIVVPVHPGGPPFTTIRRPDAPGLVCNFRIDGNGFACPYHFRTVNEATPDEEASQLYTTTMPSTWATDLYHIPDIEPPERPIAQVHIVGRFKNIGTRPTASVARSIIYTHGVIYEDSVTYALGATYENKHWHLYANPFTGLPWTYQEVTDLQIGVKIRNRRGIGWTARGYCTQLYCIIEHDCSAYE